MSPVDAAAQCPTAVGIGAVVYPAILTEETLSAEGLHIDRHPVAWLDIGDCRADIFHNANHLTANSDAGYSSGDAAVFDVEVTGADTGQRDPHDGISVIEQDRLGLVL